MIDKILDVIESATSLHPEPFDIDSVRNGITYKYYTSTDDGAVARKRLELTLITLTLEDADKYRKEIINALVTSGDESKLDGIYKCVQNGGGTLKNYETNTIHTMMYFDVIERTEN